MSVFGFCEIFLSLNTQAQVLISENAHFFCKSHFYDLVIMCLCDRKTSLQLYINIYRRTTPDTMCRRQYAGRYARDLSPRNVAHSSPDLRLPIYTHRTSMVRCGSCRRALALSSLKGGQTLTVRTYLERVLSFVTHNRLHSFGGRVPCALPTRQE